MARRAATMAGWCGARVRREPPFDLGSAFFIATQALGLARVVGVPVEAVVAVLAPDAPHV